MARPVGSFESSRAPGSGAPKGNVSGQTLGHRGALTAYRRGEVFRGLAAEKERAVRDRLTAIDGVAEIMTDNAVALETCKELYKDAILFAEQKGELKTLEQHLKTYAMLTAKANAEWARILELQRDGGGALILDALDAAQAVQDGS